MDEMKIKSKLLTSIISKIISKSLKKQLGIDCELKINDILFSNDGSKTTLKLSLEGSVNTSDIPKVVDKFLA